MVYSRSYGIYILHTNVDLKKIVILFYFTQHHIFDIMCCIYISIIFYSIVRILLFYCFLVPINLIVLALFYYPYHCTYIKASIYSTQLYKEVDLSSTHTSGAE